MKLLKYFLISMPFFVSCGEKKEEIVASTSKAILPDGTEVELDSNRLYSDGICELENVDTSTYRKTYFSLAADKFQVWSVVFLNDACDISQDHVIFGAPTTFSLLNYDGSTGSIDMDDNQEADYNVAVTDEQLTLDALTGELEDQSYAKESAAFSLARFFDFSLDVSSPTTTNDTLEVSFTLALLTDDFLVDDVSYLKSVSAEVICKLASGLVLRPKLAGSTSMYSSPLDGAGTYTASIALASNQKGVAVKSCEVIIDRTYERTGNSSRGAEIKNDVIVME